LVLTMRGISRVEKTPEHPLTCNPCSFHAQSVESEKKDGEFQNALPMHNHKRAFTTSACRQVPRRALHIVQFIHTSTDFSIRVRALGQFPVAERLVTHTEAGAIREHTGSNVHGEQFLEKEFGSVRNVNLRDACLVVARTAFVVTLLD
jgi:hypothetical protein